MTLEEHYKSQQAINALQEARIEIEHFFGDGEYIKKAKIPAGVSLAQHKHTYEHQSQLLSGSVDLYIGSAPAERHHAPACITIKAHEHHAIFALTDVVWLCIHETECTDIELIDSELIADDPGDARRYLMEKLH